MRLANQACVRARLDTLVLAVAAVVLVSGAAAATPMWTLDIVPGDMQNNFNVPKFILTNTSTAGEDISSFSFSIGDPAFFFDFVADLSSGPAGQAANVATEAATGAVLLQGDRVNDRSGVDTLIWSFSDFQVGESLIFEVDVDPASAGGGGSQTSDARTVFFSNGPAPNSVSSIGFSDGAIETLSVPDDSGSAFNYSSGSSGVVLSPEPSTALLMLLGLLGLAWGGGTSRPAPPRAQLLIELRVAKPQSHPH